MKRIWCFAIVFVFVMGLVGCKQIESSEISGYDRILNINFELTDEQEKDLLKLWNEGKWTRGLTKTHCGYEFVLNDGSVIRYYHMGTGLFSDLEGERTMHLTKKQTAFVNEIINEQLEVSIAPSDVTLNKELTEASVQLTGEEMQEFFSIWNDGDWEIFSMRPGYDYGFSFEDTEPIAYESETGIFTYWNYKLTVTEGERQQINGFIEQQFAK